MRGLGYEVRFLRLTSVVLDLHKTKTRVEDTLQAVAARKRRHRDLSQTCIKWN